MRIEKLTITRVFVNDKNKEGLPLLTKAGKPYRKIAIQTQEYGNEYLSSFIFEPGDEKLNWKSGQTISVIVEKNGQWFNFRMPTNSDYQEIRMESLEKRIEALEDFAKNKVVPAMPDMLDMLDMPVGPDEINTEEIPF